MNLYRFLEPDQSIAETDEVFYDETWEPGAMWERDATALPDLPVRWFQHAFGAVGMEQFALRGSVSIDVDLTGCDWETGTTGVIGGAK